MNPAKALLSTITELLDSKKWVGSYVATIVACVLHLYFGLSIQDSLLLVSPIAIGVAGQAHVDAATAKQPKQLEGALLETTRTISFESPHPSEAVTPVDRPAVRVGDTSESGGPTLPSLR